MANANIILLYFCNYVDVFFALLINCKNRCWGKFEFIWGVDVCYFYWMLLRAVKATFLQSTPPPANAGEINYINKYYSSNLFGNKCDISK